MVPAVIEFDFDPALHLGDLAVRWEALALALTIVVCIALAAVMAGRTSAVNAVSPEMGGLERGARNLRRDDLLYILLGVVPAALLGGRLGYILTHWDFYSGHPEAWFDPTQGGLELSLAVVFGMLAGYAVAAGLGAPAGRWLHLAAVPVLLGLTAGKFVGVVGGTGQGAESSRDWSTAYLGPGPWGSPDAAIPAHPSQLYEAVLSLLVMGLIVFLLRIGRFRDHDGRVFFAAMCVWALTRVAAAFTWRDPVVVGPFGAAQVLGITIAVLYVALFVLRGMYTRRTIRAVRTGAMVGAGATGATGAGGAAGVAAASGLAAAAVVRDREESGAAIPIAAEADVIAYAAAAPAKARRGARLADEAAAAIAVGVSAPIAAATVEVERLAAAATYVSDTFAATTSWRSGPVWLERLEPEPSGEAAVKPPAPVTVPGALLVTRSVIVEPVVAEPVVGTARRAAKLVEVAVAGPEPAPTEAMPAPTEPAILEPAHLVPVIGSSSPAVPIWQDIEHERLAPAATGEVSEQVMMEGGQPRHRTARELLAMAEAVRLAEKERVGRPAPVRIPAAVSISAPPAAVVVEMAAPKPVPVQAVSVTAVLVELLEAEAPVPVGIVSDDPLARRTDPFTLAVVAAEPSVTAERLDPIEAREEAVTERVESLEPVLESAEPEPVDTEPVVATVEPSVGARSPEPEPEAPAAEPEAVAPAESVTMEIEEIDREQVSAAAGLDDPLAPRHDLFEAMGEPAGRFETPTEAPTPELARAAGRANLEYRADHVIEAAHEAMPLETAEPEAFAAAEPGPAAPEPIGAEELEPAPAELAPAAAVAPARRARPRRTVAQPKPKPLVEPVPAVALLETQAIASASEATAEAAPMAEPAAETAAAPDLAGTGADAPAPEFEPSAAVTVEATVEPEPAAEAASEAPSALLAAPAWAAEDAEDEGRGTPPIDQEREARRAYRPVRSRREYEERQRAEEESSRAAQESPDWTAAALRREAEGEAGEASEAGAVAPAPDVKPEPAALVEPEPALEPEPAAVVEPEPAARARARRRGRARTRRRGSSPSPPPWSSPNPCSSPSPSRPPRGESPPRWNRNQVAGATTCRPGHVASTRSGSEPRRRRGAPPRSRPPGRSARCGARPRDSRSRAPSTPR